MDAQDTTAAGGHRRLRLAIAGTALVLAAGLAVAVVTIPLPGTERPAASPVRAISDVRSADVCSTIDAAALAGFGDVVVRPDTGTFPGCMAEIRSAGTPLFTLTVELLTRPETDQYIAPAPWDGFRPVVTGGHGDGGDPAYCQRYVLLPDGNAVQFSVDTDGSQATCPVADAAAHAAAAALAERPIGARPRPDDTMTFGSADACALLTPAAPVFVKGSAPGMPGFGGWSCYWSGSLADVVLDFFRYPPPGEGGFEAFTVGGRAGMTRTLGWTCRIYIPQRAFRAGDGSARTEYVRISVDGGRAADRCARAAGIAELVVAALPPQQ
jgi:hypothetical protein